MVSLSSLCYFCFSMIIVSWNCRGAGSRTFPHYVKDVTRKYYVDLLCLYEPRISGDKAERVSRKLGFSNWLRIEANGFARGI